MAGYRQAAEVIKQYRQLADKQKILTDETLTEEQATEILDQSIGLMEAFRDAVRIAIRDEQYNKHLKSVEDDIPFTAWLQILSVIIQEYGAYFQDITSTEGEL
jgi:hypothetical protein